MLPRPHTIGRPSICPSAAAWWLRGRAVAFSEMMHAEHKVSKIAPATAALCGTGSLRLIERTQYANGARGPVVPSVPPQITPCDEKAPPLSGGAKSLWPRSGGDGAITQEREAPGRRAASAGLARLGIAGDFDFAIGASEKKKTRTAGQLLKSTIRCWFQGSDLRGQRLHEPRARRRHADWCTCALAAPAGLMGTSFLSEPRIASSVSSPADLSAGQA
jgi:hypothetical protein